MFLKKPLFLRKSFWRSLRPGPVARKGAAWGFASAVAAVWVVVGFDLYWRASSHPAVWLPWGLVLLAALLAGGLVALIGGALGRLPIFHRWLLATGLPLVTLAFMASPRAGLLGAAAVLVASSLTGAGAASLARRRLGMTSRQFAIATAGVVVGPAIMLAGAGWLWWDGPPAQPVSAAGARSTVQPAPVALADPSLPGHHKVLSLTYGSGADRHRPEYAARATLRTKPVDGSRLIERWSGRSGWARTRYWGFDARKLPLQGRVWYPDGAGPFPLVLVVHGNHTMEEYSDPGYSYLGELLTSRGFILVSVDENFLNSSVTDLLGLPDVGLKEENDARGWLLLEHFRVWRAWNREAGNRFLGKVDMNNLALIGHSRGGEAVAVAAMFNRLPYYPDDARLAFDYNFDLRSIIAIAPVDGQYQPSGAGTVPRNVNYFVVHGSMDGDVQSFDGSRVYQRVRFDRAPFRFKSFLYVQGANHGQFNTSWGRYDGGGLGNRFLGTRSIMAPEDQLRIAKVYFTAFLEATLRGQTGYLPLFRDHRAGRAWLPRTTYIHRYEDSTDRLMAGFDEDFDITTATLSGGSLRGENLTDWKERLVKIKWGDLETRGVLLGWNTGELKDPRYTLRLPRTGFAIDPADILVLSLADAKQDPSPLDPHKKPDPKKKKEKKKEPPVPIDLTLEVADTTGQSARLALGGVSRLQPQIEARVLKAAFLSSVPSSEVVFQTFEFPLASFVAANPRLDPGRLAEVRLRFDSTTRGVVILDNLSLRRAVP